MPVDLVEMMGVENTFNSLFEMRKLAVRRELVQRRQISILYLRCCPWGRGSRRACRTFQFSIWDAYQKEIREAVLSAVTFNSLFEMHQCLVFRQTKNSPYLSILYLRCPHALEPLDQRRLRCVLSILYLRCRDVEVEINCFGLSITFNSLFEMRRTTIGHGKLCME